MEDIPTLLTIDRLTQEEILREADFTIEDGKYCFEIFSKIFHDLIAHPNKELLDMHPLERILLTLDSKGMKELFTFAVELEEAMQIPNHKGVLDRLRSNDLGDYLSARGEIKAGAWMKNGMTDVEFIVPNSRKGKTADLKGIGDFGELHVEVKSENQFDLSIGINNMFKGWVQSHLRELVPLKNTQLQISFGAYWVDAIGAACRINQKMKGASWAFHSVVMAISSEAARKIYENKDHLTLGRDFHINPDIEVFMTEVEQSELERIVVKMPDSTKLATIGRLVRDVTEPEYLKQAEGNEFAFFSYVQENPDERMASTMLGNLFLQSPDLEKLCLGLVIANSENTNLVYIHNMRGTLSHSAEMSRRGNKLLSAFRKPKKLERIK